MNGSVVPLIEKSKHDDILRKTEAYREMFYTGEPLTDLETDI